MRLGVLVLLLVAGCNQLTQEGRLIEDGKRAAADKLKDPNSAEFRDVRICPDNQFMVTGEINGKNSFGAYAGYEKFWARSHSASLLGEVDDEFGWIAIQDMLNCEGSTLPAELRTHYVERLPEELREYVEPASPTADE